MNELHSSDFSLWTEQTAARLKNREFDQVDWANLIEEIEELGTNKRDRLISSLKILIAHLLKWHYQPGKRSRSWQNTIFRERGNIEEYIEDSKSLKRFLESPEWMRKAYLRARRLAAHETGINESVFPLECPYAIEQVLDFNFFPN